MSKTKAQSVVIAIDHGNRSIKTKNHSFIAGFIKNRSSFAGDDDILVYEGNEYILAENGRISERSDKTMDDDYFVLTLFAIGKELMHKNADLGALKNKKGAIEVTLLIGLPPEEFRENNQRDIAYYARKGQVEFKYGGVSICIEITDVRAYPQALAAAVAMGDEIGNFEEVNIIDIGGGTLDCMKVLKGLRPDMDVVKSLRGNGIGVNGLVERINSKERQKGKNPITETTIEGIVRCDASHLQNASVERQSLILGETKGFVEDMLKMVKTQTKFNFEEDVTLFIGGGALLLRRHIEESGLVARAIFAKSDKDNALGYEMMYLAQNERQTPQPADEVD